jgi:hypothetical protein
MRVDLKKALSVSEDCLQSRARLKGIMRDLYPEEKREVNILLNVFESGAPSRIARQGAVSGEEYKIFLKKIVGEYAMQEYYAMQALDAWIDVLLGDGTAAGIKESMTGLPLFAATVEAPECKESLYSYQEIVHGYAITKYVGTDEAIISLPDTYHQRPVLRVAKEAFRDCLTVKRVFLGRNIKILETGAFRGCRRLEAVYGSERLEYIGDAAFSGCENLYDLKVSNLICYLGKNAFRNTAMTSFVIPQSLDYISAGLFGFCHKLSSVTIHDRVIALGAGCFAGCDHLDRLVVPGSVKYIGKSAFLNCGGSQTFTIESPYGAGPAPKCGKLEDAIGILVKMRWKSDSKEKKRNAISAIEESDEVIVEDKEWESVIIFRNPSGIRRHIIDSLLVEYFKKREPGSPEPFVIPYTKARMVEPLSEKRT